MFYFNSSAIRAADYDPLTQEMRIWFHGGRGPYTFYHVPQDIFSGLCNAASTGAYYNTYIRGRYR